jgi:transcriptional regulator with XRE-family HTH domain
MAGIVKCFVVIIFNIRSLSAGAAIQTYNLSMGNAKTLGQRVRVERVTLSLSQADLAEKVGVSRGYISDIERDSETINIGNKTVVALAGALGVSPAYLMGLTDNPLQGVEDEEDNQPANQPLWVAGIGKELLDVFQNLSANDQAMLLSIAKRLKAADTPRIIG